MEFEIVLLVLVSATIHPFWNLLLKKYADPNLGFIFLIGVMSLCALAHGLFIGADFLAILDVLPFLSLSVFGLLLYGICLAKTLMRGDLSVYYPIIRASPIFVVIASVVFLGKSYSNYILIGISFTVVGAFFVLHERNSKLFKDPLTLGFALLAMSGTGIYSLSDAYMMKFVSPPVLLFFADGLLVPIYFAMWRMQRKSSNLTSRAAPRISIYMVIPGILAYLSYYLILVAYQRGGEVAAVTSIRQLSIPISVILGGIFLYERDTWKRLFGAGLVSLGIVVIAHYG